MHFYFLDSKIFQSGKHFTILKYQSHANDNSIILRILYYYLCFYENKNYISWYNIVIYSVDIVNIFNLFVATGTFRNAILIN